MFKQAYVRGVANALIQSGHVAFPDEDTSIKVADYIADHVDFDPSKVERSTRLKIAEAVLDASAYLRNQPGFRPGAMQKVASVEDLGKLAHVHAIHLMEKAAEGSTIEGGDKGNDAPNSAEGKLDLSQRPAGYAENSLGTSDVDTRPGAVGKEEPQPNAPSESPSGSNSLIEASKSASLGALIRKVAEGSTIMGGDKGNSEPTTAEGKMDASMRPPGYALLPSQGALGEMMNQISGNAVVGRETPHPNGPSESPSGSNSLIEHSNKAAAEDPYITVFKKTAAEVVKYLPVSTPENVKISHVRACMGMTLEEKAHYLVGLNKEAAMKTAVQAPAAQGYKGYDGRNANQKRAGEMPDFIQDKIDAKKDGGGDKDKDKDDKDDKGSFPGAAPPFGKKDDEKDEEKKDDEKKEAALAAHFRRISAALNPSA